MFSVFLKSADNFAVRAVSVALAALKFIKSSVAKKNQNKFDRTSKRCKFKFGIAEINETSKIISQLAK